MGASSRCVALLGAAEIALRFEERFAPCVPLGQRSLAEGVLASVKDADAFREKIEREYDCILDTLLEAGVPFRILNLAGTESDLAERLREEGFPSFDIPVPEVSPARLYPRDLFTYFTDRGIALLEESSFTADAADREGVDLRRSCWGEGGRVIAAGDCIVVCRHPDRARARDQETLDILRERGIRVAEIPAGIACALDDGGALASVFYDSHIDRAAGLARGADGTCHLLIPSTFQTGSLTGPDTSERSLEAVRRVCEGAEIEVRVVGEMTAPMATSLVQFPDGVIVTGCCDGEWVGLLESIVGAGKVFATERTLEGYPTFGGAGIHCLVTESPEFWLTT